MGGIASLLILPIAFLVLANWRPEWDPAVMALQFHFWVVSGAALMAGGLAAVVIASARSLRQTQALFVALGFMALAIIFSAHGLTTWPGNYEHHEDRAAATQVADDGSVWTVDEADAGEKQEKYADHDPSGTVVSAWLSLAAAALFV